MTLLALPTFLGPQVRLRTSFLLLLVALEKPTYSQLTAEDVEKCFFNHSGLFTSFLLERYPTPWHHRQLVEVALLVYFALLVYSAVLWPQHILASADPRWSLKVQCYSPCCRYHPIPEGGQFHLVPSTDAASPTVSEANLLYCVVVGLGFVAEVGSSVLVAKMDVQEIVAVVIAVVAVGGRAMVVPFAAQNGKRLPSMLLE